MFLFPTEMEAEPFRQLAPDAEVRISGVGAADTAVATAKALREGYRHIVLAGIAGSYDATLEAGAVVAVSEERMAGLPDEYARPYRSSRLPKELPAVISNTVSACGARPDGARIENMEGAVFMALCDEAGVRCQEIRAVSNLVGAPREEWNILTATENLARCLNDTFLKRSFMERNKIILWIALTVIVIAAILLVVSKGQLLLREIMTWIIVIMVSFLAGWLIGRFGGRRRKTAN